jgi:hypothetical protein
MATRRPLVDLSSRDAWLLAQAWAALVAARARLRLSPSAALSIDAGPLRVRRNLEAAPATLVGQLTRAVDRAARIPPRAGCLARAIAASRLLRRHGIDSTVRLGVAREGGGGIAAHAWLECDGQIVLGEPVREYAALE